MSKSDMVYKRLKAAEGRRWPRPVSFEAIADLIGSVDRLPRDLSARKKRYLKSTGYGGKRPRRR